MVSEDRRWKEKPGMNWFYRAHHVPRSLAKCLHTKRVEHSQDWFSTLPRPLFHCFVTPIWLPHIVMCISLYTLLCCVVCFLIVKIHFYFKPLHKRNEKS